MADETLYDMLMDIMREEYEEFPYPTRSILLGGEGIKGYQLGIGYSDCERFYDMASMKQIPEVECIDMDYAFNCDVKFKGSGLAAFLQREYPEHYEKLSDTIIPDAEYEISSIDFS